METEMKRKELIVDAKEAAVSIEDGMTISIGGFLLSSHPMTIIREVIKRGVKNLTVMGPVSASLETDILIGTGCVKKVITSYAGVFELITPSNVPTTELPSDEELHILRTRVDPGGLLRQ